MAWLAIYRFLFTCILVPDKKRNEDSLYFLCFLADQGSRCLRKREWKKEPEGTWPAKTAFACLPACGFLLSYLVPGLPCCPGNSPFTPPEAPGTSSLLVDSWVCHVHSCLGAQGHSTLEVGDGPRPSWALCVSFIFAPD